jgi:integrase
MIRQFGRKWYLYRRVPKDFAEVESRRFIKHSLKTDSESEAQRRAIVAWDGLVAGWNAALGGDFEQAEERYKNAKQLARGLGFQFLPSKEVLKLPIRELLERVEATNGRALIADATLGLAPVPELATSEALDLFWGLSKDVTAGKTPDQIRRWKNPRIKSFRLFDEVVGPRTLSEISRDDMMDMREYLAERIVSGEITGSTANKVIIHFTGVLRHINKTKRLGLDLPFGDLSFKEKQKATRDPFSVEWMHDKLLGDGNLDGLNAQARAILKIMINTGARPSEIAGLKPHHFELDGAIPMISIEPDGRDIKNEHSRRRVPLAGVSLDAAKESAVLGFPTYFGKDKVSDTINKYLRENGLKETSKTTLYSLRHSFEDRLLAAGVDERIRKDLMGHALQRQRYGTAGGHEARFEAIKRIAI